MTCCGHLSGAACRRAARQVSLPLPTRPRQPERHFYTSINPDGPREKKYVVITRVYLISRGQLWHSLRTPSSIPGAGPVQLPCATASSSWNHHRPVLGIAQRASHSKVSHDVYSSGRWRIGGAPRRHAKACRTLFVVFLPTFSVGSFIHRRHVVHHGCPRVASMSDAGTDLTPQ